MSEVQKRYVKLAIYVDSVSPHLCHAPSSSASGDSPDGCPSLIYTEDGEALCGAFGDYLGNADDDVNDECSLHFRCELCLEAELR